TKSTAFKPVSVSTRSSTPASPASSRPNRQQTIASDNCRPRHSSNTQRSFGTLFLTLRGLFMRKRLLAMSVLFAATAWAQTPAPKTLPKFQATDVQPAPYRTFPFANGGVLRGDRYIWHQATIVDLVAAAYSVNVEMVQGGPPWLERDRFEVIGLADPKT